MSLQTEQKKPRQAGGTLAKPRDGENKTIMNTVPRLGAALGRVVLVRTGAVGAAGAGPGSYRLSGDSDCSDSLRTCHGILSDELGQPKELALNRDWLVVLIQDLPPHVVGLAPLPRLLARAKPTYQYSCVGDLKPLYA